MFFSLCGNKIINVAYINGMGMINKLAITLFSELEIDERQHLAALHLYHYVYHHRNGYDSCPYIAEAQPLYDAFLPRLRDEMDDVAHEHDVQHRVVALYHWEDAG